MIDTTPSPLFLYIHTSRPREPRLHIKWLAVLEVAKLGSKINPWLVWRQCSGIDNGSPCHVVTGPYSHGHSTLHIRTYIACSGDPQMILCLPDTISRPLHSSHPYGIGCPALATGATQITVQWRCIKSRFCRLPKF